MSASDPSPTVTEIVRFEDLPLGSRGTRRAIARWSDGTESEALTWYADEILICEGDLHRQARQRSLRARPQTTATASSSSPASTACAARSLGLTAAPSPRTQAAGRRPRRREHHAQADSTPRGSGSERPTAPECGQAAAYAEAEAVQRGDAADRRRRRGSLGWPRRARRAASPRAADASTLVGDGTVIARSAADRTARHRGTPRIAGRATPRRHNAWAAERDPRSPAGCSTPR